MTRLRTYLILATASILLLGSLNALAQTDLTPSIQDANFASAGSYTAVLGALGSTSNGAIGTAGFSTYNWTTGWSARFVNSLQALSLAPSTTISGGILTLGGLSTVGTAGGINSSAYQTLAGQSYQAGIYTLTTSVTALGLISATTIQNTGIGIGFLSGSSTTTAIPSAPFLGLGGGVISNSAFGTEADNSGAGATSTLGVTLLPGQSNAITFQLNNTDGHLTGAIGIELFDKTQAITGSSLTSGATFGPVSLTFTLGVSSFSRTGSGTWGTASEWTPNGVPNGAGDTAELVLPVSGTQTVDLGGATFTLNQLNVTGAGGGAWAVNNGTLIFDGAAPTFTDQSAAAGISTTVGANLQLNAGTTFNIVNLSAVAVVTGAISGAGQLIKTGSGTLTLTGPNTYIGGTMVASGVLSVADDTNLGAATGGLTLQGGELLTTGVNFSSSRLVTLDPSGSANTLAAATGTTATYAGNVSGAGGLRIGDGANTGTVVLSSGGNTYMGGTTVSGGATLSINTDAELGNTSGGITLNGGKLVMTASNFSTARTLTLGPGSNILAAPDINIFRFPRFTGMITGAGALTVGDANSAELTVTLTNPSNDYGGGTTITGGAILAVDTNGELGNPSGGIALVGGTLRTTSNGFTSARAITLVPGAAPNSLAAQFNQTASYTGLIGGSGGLTISSGTVVLTNTGNSYLGGTTVQSSTLIVATDSELGAPSGGLTLSGGKMLTTVDGFASARSILLNQGEGNDALAAAPGTTATYTGPISGSAPLNVGFSSGVVRQDGVVVLTNLSNFYTGGTSITAGATLKVNADAELGATRGGLTLQGGELLTTGNGFNSARTIGLRTGTDILAAAIGTTATYTGLISRNGVVLMIGDFANAGTVVLSGNNTYNGGTEINPGTLVAAGNNALGSGPVRLFRGTLAIPAGVTLSNPVSFVEGGVVNNAGTLNNSITDAFSVAETVINSGTINGSVTLGGATDIVQLLTGSKITGNVVLAGSSSSTLILDGTGQQLLSLAVVGTLTNNGTLVKQGSGTWTIDRALDAPVGTDILAGTLAVDAVLTTPLVNITPGATLQLNSGGSVGNLVDDGSLIFASTGTVTFGTAISGPGNVIQDGAGTTILSGRNTYRGGTVIDLGTLLVGNAQALGTGDVTVNGGVLAADPQPINVLGNYTQNAGGTLQLNIAGPASGQFDVLNVAGNAALNGTLRLLNLGYQPQNGDKLRLITTGGVITGRFAQFQNPFALAVGFNTIDLVYARTSVTLEFLTLNTPVAPVTPSPPVVVMTTDFSSFAFTPNQLAAANLLDAVQLDPRAANLISFLNTEPFANLPTDFQKISPDGLTAFYEISFSNANIQKLTLEGRLDDLHNGSNGFSSNMKVNGATVNDKATDGKTSKAVVEPILQHAPENRWGVWVTGFGDFVNVDADGNAKGYNFTTGGVSLGIDYRITDQLAIGAMGEYSHTWTSLNPNGHIDVNSGRGGVYATWFSHGLYINGAIYGGHNNYDSGRAGLGGLANGGTEGAEWSTFVGSGYDFHFGPLTIGPIASLQYTDVGIDGFAEKGSLAPLAIHSGSAESLRSDVGFRAFYQWQIGKVLIEPSLKAAWEHEYKYSALPITAGFAGIPGPSSTFFGSSEGRDSAVVSAGVSVRLTPAISTYVNYDGQLGRGNYDSNAVTGGVRINF